jgi:hypothetical protein
MGKQNTQREIWRQNVFSKRPLGKQRRILEDNIQYDVGEVHCENVR